jgi:hypothetical protein
VNASLDFIKQRFALLKDEWGKWQLSDGSIKFESADSQKTFDDLTRKMSEG